MKPYTLLLVVVISLNLVQFTFLMRGEKGAGTPARSVSVSGAPVSELHRRVAELEDENRSLRDRLSLLEDMPVPEAPAREPLSGFVTRSDFDAFRDEMEEALGRRSVRGEGPSSSPQFKQEIATALTEIRHQEAVDKVRSKQEARLADLDEKLLPRVEEWLQLTPSQTHEMRTALLNKFERESELIRRWEAGEDDEILGEQKASDRETLRVELSRFLSPEQLETYLSRGGTK